MNTPQPDFTDIERLKQTIGASSWGFLILFGPIISWIFITYITFFTSFWFATPLYLIYYYFDIETPQSGTPTVCQIFRNVPLWKHAASYFPLEAVKTSDLPLDRNYLFCVYPHGLLSINTIVHLLTNGSDFHEKYPGLETFVATLNMHFITPIMREILLSLGLVSSSMKSLVNVLSSKRKGVALALVVGGGQEALYAKPGSFDIVLKNRKGFIKAGLRTGASLVPVFAFGENDLFDQLLSSPESLLHKFQLFLKKLIGFPIFVPVGRGLFGSTFSIIPFQKPVVTVFGAPIHLPLEEDPKEESVDKFHTLFKEALIKLFNEHKHKYVDNPEKCYLIIR